MGEVRNSDVRERIAPQRPSEYARGIGFSFADGRVGTATIGLAESAKGDEHDYTDKSSVHVRKMGLSLIEGLRKRAVTSQKATHMSRLRT